MRMCLTIGDKHMAYVIILVLRYGLQELLIHLETCEDVLVLPYPLGSTTNDLLGEQGNNHLFTIFGVFSLILVHLESIRHPQWPKDSSYSLFFPLERLFLILLSYLGGIVKVMSLLCIILLLGLN